MKPLIHFFFNLSKYLHEARIRETEDRKGYIEAHVGHEVFRKVEEEVDREVDRNDIKDLENELIRLKRE